jgi:hypothetical protein
LFPFPESKPGLLQYSPQPVAAAAVDSAVVAWVVVVESAALPWPFPWSWPSL